jgi:hypothetical protein
MEREILEIQDRNSQEIQIIKESRLLGNNKIKYLEIKKSKYPERK